MDKRKIYLISGIVIIGSILLWVAIDSLPDKKDSESKEVSLRTNIQEEFTIDNMVTAQSTKKENSSSPETDNAFQDIPTEDPEAISRIQSLIRENEHSAKQNKEIMNTESEDDTELDSPKMISPEEVLAMQMRLQNQMNNVPEAKKEKKKEKKKEEVVPSSEVKNPVRKSRFNSVVLQKKITRNAIKAYVHSEQIVQEGATLKMRIAEDCYTDDGTPVKKNASIYGMVKKIDGERVIVEIQTVNVGGNILPFNREVFSKDAIEGIWVPGNAKADVSKEIESGVADGINVPTVAGMGVGTQLIGSAANAAVSGGKAALSKQTKKIKVTIKTNYEIYLMVPEKNNAKNTSNYEEEE